MVPRRLKGIAGLPFQNDLEDSAGAQLALMDCVTYLSATHRVGEQHQLVLIEVDRLWTGLLAA